MGSSPVDSKMGVPEAVLEKVGAMPDVSAMSKDDLAALCKQLYDKSCVVFGEKFDEEYQVRKRDMEIHNPEMETSESHGTFKIPKLKKVNKFKMMGDEEAAEGKWIIHVNIPVNQQSIYLTCKCYTRSLK